MTLKFIFCCFAFLLSTLIGQAAVSGENTSDSYLWLEDIDSSRSLAWVKKMNQRTDQSLGTDPLFKTLYQDVLTVLDSKDKLPDVDQIGDSVFQLYKSPDNPRGVYRRTSLASFSTSKPDWQIVLDIDALSKQEGVNWVFQGMDCLKPDNQRCLVSLSPGGGDAVELREFDLQQSRFYPNGFRLPVSKMQVSWLDENKLFVATDFGEGSMTDSGYPRILKIWKRGTDLQNATQIFSTAPENVWAGAERLKLNEKTSLNLIYEALDFWERNYYLHIDGKNHKLHLPTTAIIEDTIDGQFLISLKADWQRNGTNYTQGSLVLADVDALRNNTGELTVLFAARVDAIVEQVKVTDNSVLLSVLKDVKSQIYRFVKINHKWQQQIADLPKTGYMAVVASNEKTGSFIVRYEDFLTPPSLYAINAKLKPKLIRQQAASFDASLFKVEQYFASSADGTKVPYFVVMAKDIRFDGKNPTHIFSYGGFRASLTPAYSGSYEPLNGAYGKAWLQRGGVFVLANIRGGGEYGPAWHAAALLENREKAFEDFEAVAEDLINKKITSAKHLGIEGRSNGGLLVAATMIRRPDLYGAIVCGVTLADMKRYHKLLAGASWMAEYGNPDTDDWQFIKRYSPYQNLLKEADYAPIYFFTSSKDDRVHPGHSRKMAARMLAMGHQVEYFENLEGGHKGSVTSEQLARRVALAYTHLWRHLSE